MNGCRVEVGVTLSATTLGGLPRKQGKVRDVYDLGDRLLLVASDRISAFDWVLPTPIPDKGRVLSSLSEFWFERLDVPNHLISSDVADPPAPNGNASDSTPDGDCFDCSPETITWPSTNARSVIDSFRRFRWRPRWSVVCLSSGAFGSAA